MIIGVIYAILFWTATIVLVLGVANKLYIYARVPAPLKIPITPAPISKKGVFLRLIQEVFLFKSLFRADKFLWLLGMALHYSLLFIIIRHFRFITPSSSFIQFMQPIGRYSGFVIVIALIGLLSRRIFIDRVRYISSPSDIAMLILIISIACSGLFMSFVSATNIGMVYLFIGGLKSFDWQPLPTDFVLLFHMGLVALLMLIFPISKLLHAPGLFFSPSLNQVDNPREKRHLSAWAVEYEHEKNNINESVDKKP